MSHLGIYVGNCLYFLDESLSSYNRSNFSSTELAKNTFENKERPDYYSKFSKILYRAGISRTVNMFNFISFLRRCNLYSILILYYQSEQLKSAYLSVLNALSYYYRFGKILIIEDAETVSPCLLPILRKQFIFQGNYSQQIEYGKI